MKSLQILASAALVSSALFAPTPSLASLDSSNLFGAHVPTLETNDGSYQEARRGRGRGGDRDRSDRKDRRDDRPSGRNKPRIPGGSGCDDPQDIIEHPECRV